MEANKAARESIEKTFKSSVEAARATFKSVKESKPDATTLAAAQDTFNKALASAEQARKDALAALPALPNRPVKSSGTPKA